jgi:phosphoenolpyruvate carboxykinase (ATP)
MTLPAPRPSARNLESLGVRAPRSVQWNLSAAALCEEAVRRQEGLIAEGGALTVRTGQYTGRSPDDRFVVKEPSFEKRIDWGGANRPFDAGAFDRLKVRVLAHLEGKDLFVQDCFVGAESAYRLQVRVVTECAWQGLFARNMFIRPDRDALASHRPQFTVVAAPGFRADPTRDGTRSEAFILLHFAQRLVLIGGTSYAGEIKKSLFSVMNTLLPPQGVLSMHASANVGPKGDVAVFFGLSGTGKTTLSADPTRTLIGDDEHGWSDRGVFNLEGGCYAKVIHLSAEAEPEIHATTRRFGTVLENVVCDPGTRRLDLDDPSLTENTRAAYPLPFIPNASATGVAGHPSHIIMLTADAFGVMPPVARLSSAQAMYHFLSGYTAKLAGTERGVTAPKATFSAGFGAPFMTLPPAVYAALLGQKISRHHAQVWLVNTGWTGGPYGEGKRMSIAHTRAILRAILEGRLEGVPTDPDPVFGLGIPRECPDVPREVLTPRATWESPAAYDAKARELAGRFAENFKAFAAQAGAGIAAAGPVPG